MGPKAFAKSEAKDLEAKGMKSVRRAAESSLQTFNVYVLAFASLLGGGAFVHQIFKPDLRIPPLGGKLEEDGEAAPSQPPVDPMEGFMAAPSFAGARAGFVFTTGPGGLGYYRDTKRQ